MQDQPVAGVCVCVGGGYVILTHHEGANAVFAADMGHDSGVPRGVEGAEGALEAPQLLVHLLQVDFHLVQGGPSEVTRPGGTRSHEHPQCMQLEEINAALHSI